MIEKFGRGGGGGGSIISPDLLFAWTSTAGFGTNDADWHAVCLSETMFVLGWFPPSDFVATAGLFVATVVRVAVELDESGA